MKFKYRRQPVMEEVEAIQYDGTKASMEAMRAFAGRWLDGRVLLCGIVIAHLTTPKGTVALDIGDWLIKYGYGVFCRCRPEVFAMEFAPNE